MVSSYGKYQVLEQVGEGGFGRVYRALDPLLKREVAIKTCTLRQPDVRARFVREAEIVASLKHPNIVTVYDFGVEDGEPYLVQEYLSGADLQVVLDSGTAVDLATKVRWLQQIAAGLLAAHAQNIIHRDIKPSNIRIQSDGDVRIMDFGIAKLLEAEQQLTQTGMSIGTTGYLAPEQLTGQDIDHRVDIFSFGVLAYELMSGRRPFAADNMTAALYRVVHEEPTPLGELAPGLPPTLTRCIMRCLEKDRDRRWASFGPVKGELQEVQRAIDRGDVPHEAVGAIAPAATEVMEPGGSRRLTPAVAGLSLFAVAVALFGVVMASRTVWGGDGGSNDAIDLEDGVVVAETQDAPVTDAPADTSVPADPVAPVPPPSSENPVSPPAGARATPPPPVVVPPPPPPPPPAALDRSRLVVLVEAGDAAAHDAAEATLVEELGRAGYAIVDGAMVQAGPGGASPAPNALASLARSHGAGFVVFTSVTSDAAASVGGMFTGTATVQVRVYDAATGDLAANQRGAVGSGNVPGKLAATAEAARIDATRAAAYQAARGIVRELR